MGQQTSQTQSSSQTSPWGPQASQLTNAFNYADQAYNNSTNNYSAPSEYTAQMTPQQLAMYQAMTAAGAGATNPATDLMTNGSSAATSGYGGAEGALTNLGAFNASTANNPSSIIQSAQEYMNGQNIPAQVAQAMSSANQEAKNVTLPGINQAMTQSGNQNSSRNAIEQGLTQQGLAENAQNLTASMEGQAFGTGLGLAESQAANNNATNLGAMEAALSGGTGLGTSGALANTEGTNNLSSAYNLEATGAAAPQQQQQLADTNALQQYLYGEQSQWTPLEQLMGIVGSANWGGNSTGTSTTTTTPSAFSTIGGLLGATGSFLSPMNGIGMFLP